MGKIREDGHGVRARVVAHTDFCPQVKSSLSTLCFFKGNIANFPITVVGKNGQKYDLKSLYK